MSKWLRLLGVAATLTLAGVEGASADLANSGIWTVVYEGEGAEQLGSPWNSAIAAPECRTANNSELQITPTAVCPSTKPHYSRYYYQYPGGPYCGLTHYFCDGWEAHQGCETQYYSEYFWCECP